MLEDKALVELSDTSRTTQVWVVDEVGPNNTWNQDGLPVLKIGGTGSGDAILGARIGWTKLFLSGAIIGQLSGMPYPGSCRVGQSGDGLWDGGITIMDRGPISWRVLRVV